MKITWILLILFSITGISQSSAQSFRDADISGVWITPEGDEIEIYKHDNAYYGKIRSLAEPLDEQDKPFLDMLNPEKSLRERPIIGIDILMNLQFDGDDVWQNGRIYVASECLVVHCEIKMISRQKLKLIVEPGFLSHSEYWTRKTN